MREAQDLEENRVVFRHVRHAIQNGDMNRANTLMKEHQEEWKTFMFYPLYTAIVLHENELEYWDRAISSLSFLPVSSELLFALDKAFDLSRRGGDTTRARGYLRKSESIAKELGDRKQHLQYLSMYANQLHLDGYTKESKELLEDIILQAVEIEDWLLIVSQATILSGIFLQEQDWKGAATISVVMEEAAKKRKNWIGVSCAVMTRASAWFSQGKEEASIRLLLDTGRRFHELGFVAALHLIKARLAELRALLGEQKFTELCEKV